MSKRMIPVRYFIILTLQLITCVALLGGITGGFAFTYSYLSGNREDRAEMDATMAKILRQTVSARLER